MKGVFSMRLSRHEAILGITTLLFILVLLILSAFPTKNSVLIETPEVSVVPYLININTADKDELDILDGIGPALADRIIKHRKNNGPFESVNELTEVSGIGPAIIDNIKDYIEI